MKNWKTYICKVRSNQTNLEALADLILRGWTGLIMAFAHGLGKIPPPEKFVTGVIELGFPFPELFAWSAGVAEFVGGLLLALGLCTRPAAGFVGITMAVAAFGRHGTDPFQKKELALFYLVIAVYFLLSGAGKYSLDAKFCRRK